MGKASEVQIRFGHRIRELRKARGYSQEDFAVLCGLDRTYIGGIERGLRNVSLRNIEIIAKAFNVSIAELTQGIDEEISHG